MTSFIGTLQSRRFRGQGCRRTPAVPCAAIRARLSTVLQPHCGGLQPGRAPPLVRAGSPALEAVGYHPPMAATTSQAVSALPFTGNPEADRLLVDEPLALLIGFVLDQQIQLQMAFSGPLELKRRIGSLDAGRIAAMDPATLEEAFRRRPALHRFPGSMARRTQELCAALVRDYGGDPPRARHAARDRTGPQDRPVWLPGSAASKSPPPAATPTQRPAP